MTVMLADFYFIVFKKLAENFDFSWGQLVSVSEEEMLASKSVTDAYVNGTFLKQFQEDSQNLLKNKLLGDAFIEDRKIKVTVFIDDFDRFYYMCKIINTYRTCNDYGFSMDRILGAAAIFIANPENSYIKEEVENIYPFAKKIASKWITKDYSMTEAIDLVKMFDYVEGNDDEGYSE